MAARLVVTAIESLIHRYISTRHDNLELDSFRHELVTMLARYLRGVGSMKMAAALNSGTRSADRR
jgi:hypothetical protein